MATILPLGVYHHEQTEASDTWTIVHSLDTYPIVDVYIDVDGDIQMILPSSITYIDGKTVELTFSEPRTGFATVL